MLYTVGEYIIGAPKIGNIYEAIQLLIMLLQY